MKANELRLGNYINTEFGIRRISGIYNDGIIQLEDGNESVIDEIQPIPLTEEWLVSFGFNEKYKSVSNRWSIGSGLRSVQIFDVEDDDGNLSGKFLYEHYLEIQHVHQLQNLYFALTGEELTLKNEDK